MELLAVIAPHIIASLCLRSVTLSSKTALFIPERISQPFICSLEHCSARKTNGFMNGLLGHVSVFITVWRFSALFSHMEAKQSSGFGVALGGSHKSSTSVWKSWTPAYNSVFSVCVV